MVQNPHHTVAGRGRRDYCRIGSHFTVCGAKNQKRIMRALVIGCGYVGIPLAKRLVELGHEAWGVRRTDESAAQLTSLGIKPFAADISQPGALDSLEGAFD